MTSLRPRLPIPTPRLVAATAGVALIVAAAPAAPERWWVTANLLMLVAFAGDWMAGVRPDAVEVARELPAVCGLHEPSTVSWRVRNPTHRPVDVWLADQLAPSLGAETRRARMVVPPHGVVRASTGIRPARRGRFQPEEIVVRVTGPLGLAARQQRRRVPGVLRVYPALPARRQVAARVERSEVARAGLRSAAGRGGGTDFDALRDYTVDDEARRIDWAATARAGKPIVRTYRSERNQNVLLLLDTGRTMAARVRDERVPGTELPRLEHALDAVVALASVATRMGDRAGLVAYADTVRAVVRPGHAGDQLHRVVEALYALHPRLVESDHRGAFAATLARFSRRALLVAVTELDQESVTATLLPALPLVVRNHVVVVAAVRDVTVSEWARAAPADLRGVYRKAAALAALEQRRATVARLRAAGAVVVDEPPARLASALADAYLDIKASGRL